MHLSTTDTAMPPRIVDDGSVRICIVNAQLDTGNLGLQALGMTTLCELRARLPRAELTILSGWPGRRTEHIHVQQPWGEHAVVFEELGCSISRNPWKPGNLRMESLLQSAGLGSSAGIITRCFADADLVVDCSSGDSFTTLYGDWRYQYITQPKRAVFAQGTPLVLMPQTFGPFASHVHDDVRDILAGSEYVWARDETSADIARSFGRNSVGICPDIAFCLPADPNGGHAQARTRIGINISGLLWSVPRDVLAKRYGIRHCYGALMKQIVRTLLTDSSVTVHLVPHVIADGNAAESDVRAAGALLEALTQAEQARTMIEPGPSSSVNAKTTISSFDFFVGTRMHSCIAALSSGVPTCAIAYSDKTAGVFETIGCADTVFDPRTSDPHTIVAGIMDAWQRRWQLAEDLARTVPQAQARVGQMFDCVAALAADNFDRRAHLHAAA